MKETKFFEIFLLVLLDSLNFILILKADLSIILKIVLYLVAIFMTSYILTDEED